MTVRNVKSAERTLALFELFSFHQRPMTVGEITTAMGIPQPSTSMLLRNLASLGYLEYDRKARTYIPTVRIVLLGSWIHRHFTLNRQLEWRLEHLYKTVGETTFLAIQNGVTAQYVIGVGEQYPAEGSHEQNFEVPSGMMRPIARSAAGRILLSLKSDDEIQGIVRRANAEANEDRLRVNVSEFMTLIRQIRAKGYAETSGDVTPGMGVIAMAIPGIVGNTPMAVAVGAPLARLHDKKELILSALNEFIEAFSKPN